MYIPMIRGWWRCFEGCRLLLLPLSVHHQFLSEDFWKEIKSSKYSMNISKFMKAKLLNYPRKHTMIDMFNYYIDNCFPTTTPLSEVSRAPIDTWRLVWKWKWQKSYTRHIVFGKYISFTRIISLKTIMFEKYRLLNICITNKAYAFQTDICMHSRVYGTKPDLMHVTSYLCWRHRRIGGISDCLRVGYILFPFCLLL